MSVSLSREEREKFAAYADQQAHDDKLMAEQATKMSGIDQDGVMAEMAKMLTGRGLAYAVVATDLRSVEEG